MDRPFDEYIKRGGKQVYIARWWGVSRAYVSQLVKKYDGDLRVEFNPKNPEELYRFYAPERQVTFAEVTFHED